MNNKKNEKFTEPWCVLHWSDGFSISFMIFMSVFDISLMMVFMGLSGNVSIELPSALSRTLKTLYGAFSAELYKVFLPLVALCDK